VYPVNRTVTHTTLLVCVSAAGRRLTPLFLAKTKKCLEVFKLGPTEGIDLKIKIVPSTYINEAIFYEYIVQTFIPYVICIRAMFPKINHQAILQMDNLRAHCSERILQTLRKNKIVAITYPPHTSHVFQVLDLSVFGIMKIRMMENLKIEGQTAEALHTLKLFRSFDYATASTLVQSSFRTGGIVLVPNDGGYTVRFDEAVLLKKSSYKQIMEKNIQISDISQRRQGSVWGVLNESSLVTITPILTPEP
jgi:hypothetical protein